MQRTALGQLDGGLSRRIAGAEEQSDRSRGAHRLRHRFSGGRRWTDSPRKNRNSGGRDLSISLDALLATVPAGEMIREGAIVVIAGPPNVGKSSLFNALLGQIASDRDGNSGNDTGCDRRLSSKPVTGRSGSSIRRGFGIPMTSRANRNRSQRALSRLGACGSCLWLTLIEVWRTLSSTDRAQLEAPSAAGPDKSGSSSNKRTNQNGHQPMLCRQCGDWRRTSDSAGNDRRGV